MGEAAPKYGPPPDHTPPYRLDEPPVKTHWLNAAPAYALTDAVVGLEYQRELRSRVEKIEDPAEREAVSAAAAEFDRKPLQRERATVALLEMMIRNYEAVHLRHLRRHQTSRAPE